MKRFDNNPLVTPFDVIPSSAEFKVEGVLNPAVTRYQDETILLLRVCERTPPEEGWMSIPVLDINNGSGHKVLRFKKGDPLLNDADPRMISYDGSLYLTTISHLRIARSKDGIHFVVDEKPFIYPQGEEEEYGIEDPRITKIGDTYYVYYVAVSRNSYVTKLVTTTDWKTFDRHGIIFPPQNKDVAIFEGSVNGGFAAFHRPCLGSWARPAMWLAYSNDMVHWGKHKLLISPRKGKWDSGRIGSGTVPIETKHGWLEIYHGADDKNTYSLGLLLMDRNDPSQVLFRSNEPLFKPEAEYEKKGFFGNVVFTNGMACYPEKDGVINLYYGCADTCVAGAQCTLDQLLSLCA